MEHSSLKGFSLIELMVAVAIVGILAAIAFPSYRNYVIRSNRADAQQALLQSAQNAERSFATANTYASLTVSPSRTPEGGSMVYEIARQDDSTNVSQFTLRATPCKVATTSCTAATAKNTVNKDDGYMEITSTGVKRWDRNNDGDTDDADETNWSR